MGADFEDEDFETFLSLFSGCTPGAQAAQARDESEPEAEAEEAGDGEPDEYEPAEEQPPEQPRLHAKKRSLEPLEGTEDPAGLDPDPDFAADELPSSDDENENYENSDSDSEPSEKRSRGVRRASLGTAIARPVQKKAKKCPQLSCLGCGRGPADADYWDDEQNVSWPHEDKSGSWCNECRNCFRSVKDSLGVNTLTMLRVWLRDQANAVVWLQNLVAFLSLKQEGAKKIRKPDVEARRDCLEWVMNFLGLPFGPVVIEPLSNSGGAAPSIDNCVQLWDPAAEACSIGVMKLRMPVLEVRDGRTVFKKPLSIGSGCAHTPRWLPGWRVATDDASQQTMVESILGKFGKIDSATLATGDSGSIVPFDKASASGISGNDPKGRVARLISKYSSSLSQATGGHEWGNLVREGLFSPMRVEFTKLQLSLNSKGCKGVDDEISKWSAGLEIGYTFVGKFRFYKNIHTKTTLCLTCPRFAKTSSDSCPRTT